MVEAAEHWKLCRTSIEAANASGVYHPVHPAKNSQSQFLECFEEPSSGGNLGMDAGPSSWNQCAVVDESCKLKHRRSAGNIQSASLNVKPI